MLVAGFQGVVADDVKNLNINTGVPQGSIVDPLLFNSPH